MLRAVAFYVWFTDSRSVRVPALNYWDGSITKDGKKSYIVVSEDYRDVREPDGEVLVCGHFQEVRFYHGGKVYNRRRRCKLCAGAVF